MSGGGFDAELLAGFDTVGLTTRGRRSGRTTRTEIWWWHLDGRFIVTGTPGPRDWFANVSADPAVTIHTPIGDYPARAEVIADPAFRRRVFTDPATRWYATQATLDELVAASPMIEIRFDGAPGGNPDGSRADPSPGR